MTLPMPPPSDAADPRAHLAAARDEIDRIDRALAELLARRVHFAHEIGRAKGALGLPIYDGAREATIAANVTAHLAEAGLSPYAVPVLDVYRTLVLVCRHAQDDPTIP